MLGSTRNPTHTTPIPHPHHTLCSLLSSAGRIEIFDSTAATSGSDTALGIQPACQYIYKSTWTKYEFYFAWTPAATNHR